MDQLALIVGLLLATVGAVGLGDRLRLPYPVLMLHPGRGPDVHPRFPGNRDRARTDPAHLPAAAAVRHGAAQFVGRFPGPLAHLASCSPSALVVVSTAVVAGRGLAHDPGHRHPRRDRAGGHGGSAGSRGRGLDRRPGPHAAAAHQRAPERGPLQRRRRHRYLPGRRGRCRSRHQDRRPTSSSVSSLGAAIAVRGRHRHGLADER